MGTINAQSGFDQISYRTSRTMRNQNSIFLVGTFGKKVLLNRLKDFKYIKTKFYYINLSQISTFAKYIFPNLYF